MQRTSRGPAKPNYKGLKRALVYLTRYKYTAILPYLFLIVATVSQLAVPWLVGNLIDAITTGVLGQQQPSSASSTDLQNSLLTLTIAVIIFSILRGLFAFLQVFTAERNSQGVAFDLRNDLFAKIQRLSFSYHDRNRTGQLMVRATDDVEKVRLFIGQGLIFLVQAVLLLGGTLIVLFTTNATLALVVVPILPLTMALFMYFGSASQPMFAEVQTRLSALNTILQENLAGIKVIKAFAREADQQAKFNRTADAVLTQQMAVSRLFTLLFPLIFLMANLGQAAVLYFGGRQIIGGTLTVSGRNLALYLIYLSMPLAQFGIIIAQMGQASASAERIFEILDAKNEVTDKPGARPLPPIQGRVAFENVTFRYFSSGEPVLRQVSFEVEPGQTLALLGDRLRQNQHHQLITSLL
ncbi:MAG: ABC transporter transmembrane domain-containing protein [Anaerolineae bacterium]